MTYSTAFLSFFLPLRLKFLGGHRQYTMYNPCTWCDSLHRGPQVNIPVRRTAHYFHFMPANDMKESMFGHRKFPRLVAIPVPLFLEASELTTKLPRYIKYMFLAHLSQRLKVSYCDHPPSVVVVVRPSVHNL